MTVALNEGHGNTLDSKIQYARALAESGLLPKAYRKEPSNVLLAVELGESLGISTIQAINGIHVVEGKPTASADLIASLVRRAGHKLRVTVDDQQLVAVAQIIRSDDPDHTFEARWDMAKAKAAGVAGKQVWKNYPGQMLRNRAITEVARMGASDALFGVIYDPEELNAPAAPEVSVQQVEATPPPAVTSLSDAIEAHKQQGGRITPEQKSEISKLIKDLELGKEEYLAAVAGFVGREVAGTNDLTAAEAVTVITSLTADPAPDEQVDTDTGEVLDAELVTDWPQVAEVAQ